MTFVPTGLTADLPDGTMRGIEVGGEGVLVANVGGTFYAINRKCPHMGFDLAKGQLEGLSEAPRVTCRMHGASFDLATGEAVAKAKLLFLKTLPKPAKTYAVRVVDGAIMIELQQAALPKMP